MPQLSRFSRISFRLKNVDDENLSKTSNSMSEHWLSATRAPIQHTYRRVSFDECGKSWTKLFEFSSSTYICVKIYWMTEWESINGIFWWVLFCVTVYCCECMYEWEREFTVSHSKAPSSGSVVLRCCAQFSLSLTVCHCACIGCRTDACAPVC